MIAAEIIRNATAAGIILAAKGDHLAVMPATRLSPELRLLLVANKHVLLAELRLRAAPPTYGTGRDTCGKPIPPLVTCGDCVHFTRNRDNPEAGIGTCVLGEPDVGGWPYFPGAIRCCDSHIALAVQTPATPETPINPPETSAVRSD